MCGSWYGVDPMYLKGSFQPFCPRSIYGVRQLGILRNSRSNKETNMPTREGGGKGKRERKTGRKHDKMKEKSISIHNFLSALLSIRQTEHFWILF